MAENLINAQPPLWQLGHCGHDKSHQRATTGTQRTARELVLVLLVLDQLPRIRGSACTHAKGNSSKCPYIDGRRAALVLVHELGCHVTVRADIACSKIGAVHESGDSKVGNLDAPSGPRLGDKDVLWSPVSAEQKARGGRSLGGWMVPGA